MNWNLTYHFKTKEEFEQAFEKLQAFVTLFSSFKGKLHEPEQFKNYYLLIKKFEIEASKIYQYVSLKSDANKKNVENAADVAKCRMIIYACIEATSFESPEIIKLGKAKVEEYLGM